MGDRVWAKGGKQMVDKLRVEGEERLVWYASYGSNLLESRFLHYIKGGILEIISKKHHGCIDPTSPRRDKSISIPYELYFAQTSSSWEYKAVSFIKHERDDSINTRGRMFLISEYQFRDVIIQENSENPKEKSLELDIEDIISKGISELEWDWYGRIVFLGHEDEIPIFTITATWGDDSIQLKTPGEKYLITIAQGLREIYSMNSDEIIAYFRNVGGIRGNILDSEIKGIVEKALA
jgi:hypothetical protein